MAASLKVLRDRLLTITKAYLNDELTNHDLPVWSQLVGQCRQSLNDPSHYRLMLGFLALRSGTAIPESWERYSNKKLSSIRSGKDQGKTVYQPKVLRKRPGTEADDYFLPQERLEKITTKKGKIRSLRVSARYLSGTSQLHYQTHRNDDTLDAVQTAVMDYLPLWKEYQLESDQLGYSPMKTIGNSMVVPHIRPFSYGFLAMGCFKVASESRQWKRRIASRLDYRLTRDLPLTDETPKPIESPIERLKEERNSVMAEVKSSPRLSKHAKRIARLILWGTPPNKVARILSLTDNMVKKAWMAVRAEFPNLKPLKTRKDLVKA